MKDKGFFSDVLQPDDIVQSIEASACVSVPGIEHDFRVHDERRFPESELSVRILRCVWCHVAACGGADDPDPCIEVGGHSVVHRSAAGTRWEVGGLRPNRVGDSRFGY